MTHTLSIDGIGGSATDVAVHQLNQASLSPIGFPVFDQKTGQSVAVYDAPGVESNYPVRVTAQTTKLAQSSTAVRRSSIALAGWARDLDNDGEVFGIQPIVYTLSVNTPGMSLEASDVMQGIENVFGLWFATLDTKVPNTALLAKFLRGVVALY